MSRDIRKTQRNRLLDVFTKAHGAEISLPEILELRISQFGARILELRREGHVIKNRTEYRDGKILSWYRLEPRPGEITRESLRADTRTIKSGDPREQIAPTETFPQFGTLAKEMEYPG